MVTVSEELILLRNREPDNCFMDHEHGSKGSCDVSISRSSHSEELHPNFQVAGRRGERKRVYKGCLKYLHRFDEMIMRPLFIYKYEKKMIKKTDQFFSIFKTQGHKIEEDFQK